MDPAFILSLVYGHLFSKGVDSAMAVSKRHISEKEFSEILNDFDQKFKNDYDVEITLCECDMQSVIEKRTLLIPLAEKYINQDNTDISRNLKQSFVNTACREIFSHENWKKEKSSKVVEKYMGFFYDLVFMKEISSIPAGYRALLNAYIDNQHDINEDLYQRILALEIIIRKSQIVSSGPVDFRPYYNEVERIFTAKKRGEYRNLIGDEPDVTSYIDAFITKEGKQISVLSFLEEWFVKNEPGVILIHGEPGHGKTTLCNKASFEFYQKRFLTDKAKNVLAISLNTGKNREIVKDGKVKLSKALVFQVEADEEIAFSFEDCRGSLLFLDGFDEFIDEAKRANVENICSFMDTVDNIAAKYEIHIVVLSRTIAVSRNLKELGRSFEHYKLSPITDEQQDNWFDQHNEYDDYRKAFKNLRNDENMQKLLRVPFLFRLIVYSRFKTVTSNIVELYNSLFAHLMRKRGIRDAVYETVKEGLMNLAFEVYCTDTIMAKMDWNPQWVFAFYVESPDGDRIGFFHASFYQYFLAKYIYSKIITITDDNVEGFIGSFAERELDDTVRQYLALMIKKEDESRVFTNIAKMMDHLVITEAYINFTPRVESEKVERSKIYRSTNIYRNTLHIAAAVSYVIQMQFKGNLDLLMRTYDSERIVLYSEGEKKADLIGANLSRAYLRGADLSGADLGGANLRGADLSEANLRGTDLRGADLGGANLRGANLGGANLRGADLNGAYLRETDLSGANLNRACLGGANLSGAYLIGADLSKAQIFRADLSGADLSGADLSGAILIGANLGGAHIIRANLSGANLSEANLGGANLRGANLGGANLIEADLTGAVLSGANLNRDEMIGANLRKAKLDEADLSGAVLSGAVLIRANLNGADLSKANLNGADLSRTIMSGTDLSGANLNGARMIRANLSGADLSRADLSRAFLDGADLSTAHLNEAFLWQATIDIKYKTTIDPFTRRYDSIRWITDQDS